MNTFCIFTFIIHILASCSKFPRVHHPKFSSVHHPNSQGGTTPNPKGAPLQIPKSAPLQIPKGAQLQIPKGADYLSISIIKFPTFVLCITLSCLLSILCILMQTTLSRAHSERERKTQNTDSPSFYFKSMSVSSGPFLLLRFRFPPPILTPLKLFSTFPPLFTSFYPPMTWKATKTKTNKKCQGEWNSNGREEMTMTTQQNQAFVPCVRGIDRPRAFHTTSDPKLCRTHGRSRLERGAGGGGGTRGAYYSGRQAGGVLHRLTIQKASRLKLLVVWGWWGKTSPLKLLVGWGWWGLGRGEKESGQSQRRPMEPERELKPCKLAACSQDNGGPQFLCRGTTKSREAATCVRALVMGRTAKAEAHTRMRVYGMGARKESWVTRFHPLWRGQFGGGLQGEGRGGREGGGREKDAGFFQVATKPHLTAVCLCVDICSVKSPLARQGGGVLPQSGGRADPALSTLRSETVFSQAFHADRRHRKLNLVMLRGGWGGGAWGSGRGEGSWLSLLRPGKERLQRGNRENWERGEGLREDRGGAEGIWLNLPRPNTLFQPVSLVLKEAKRWARPRWEHATAWSLLQDTRCSAGVVWERVILKRVCCRLSGNGSVGGAMWMRGVGGGGGGAGQGQRQGQGMGHDVLSKARSLEFTRSPATRTAAGRHSG